MTELVDLIRDFVKPPEDKEEELTASSNHDCFTNQVSMYLRKNSDKSSNKDLTKI